MPRASAAAGASDGAVGSLAIVLHSHMPYVEGYGTYPFGEEWLFDAFLRSYAPVLEVARSLTMSVTPVLADQLEADGVAERLRRFGRELRIASGEADTVDMDDGHAAAIADELERYERALAALEGAGGAPLELFAEAERAGRVELLTSSATHAVLPLVATLAGRRLQLDAGLRSHRRRFGDDRPGLWLPECAYEPGIDRLVAELDLPYFVVDQSAHERGLEALTPIASPAGPTAFTIDWEPVSWLWSLQGYPSAPVHRDFHRESLRGMRAWSIDGRPYDPEAARATARRQAGELLAGLRERLATFRNERGRAGLCVFAIDTELLGHWWWEGPVWLEAVLEGAEAQGIDLVTLSEAHERHPAEPRELTRASWGEGKNLRTWDSPPVADLTFAARRLELRLLRALRDPDLADERGRRAARELLAVQASDWAFLDRRGQAGDYPFRRVADHAEAMLDALDCAAVKRSANVRNLAPDLGLEPLLAP